jgi:hypothetical protein
MRQKIRCDRESEKFCKIFLRTKQDLSMNSLRPKSTVVLDLCATSLTRFLENTCNIYISK